MPYKRHEPVSESVMLSARYLHHHTICATLRRIYIRIDDEEAKMELRLAMAMAKRMHEKLKIYKKKEQISLLKDSDGI